MKIRKNADKDIKRQRSMVMEELLAYLYSANQYYDVSWLDESNEQEDFNTAKKQIIDQSSKEIKSVRENVRSMNLPPMDAIDKASKIYSETYSKIISMIEKEKNNQTEQCDITNFYCFSYLIRFIDVFIKNENYKYSISGNQKMHEQIKSSGRINNIKHAFVNKKYAAVCHELVAIVNAYDIFEENIYNLISDVITKSLDGFDLKKVS